MIKISTIKEDLKNPYAQDYGSHIALQDTVEFKKMKADRVRELKAERERTEKDQEKLDALQRFDKDD